MDIIRIACSLLQGYPVPDSNSVHSIWEHKTVSNNSVPSIGLIVVAIYNSHNKLVIKGSNMVFHAFTFARSRGRCWKPRPKAAVFNTSQGTWRMLMHWKTMFDRYYCIKTENNCYILRYFLHYFVSPFHRCLANVISTDYARSRAGQYTSRNGSKFVAPVQA